MSKAYTRSALINRAVGGLEQDCHLRKVSFPLEILVAEGAVMKLTVVCMK